MGRGPDFIGIGMERAGTSWLFSQIASHPDIWVPPLKELHFFDVIDPPAKYLTHRYFYHLKSRLKQKAAPFMKLPNRPEFKKNDYLTYLLWDFYFFTGRFDVQWYTRLFDKRFTGGKICGEITPAYSNLTAETIHMILEMNPQVKFLLSVRNPMKRMLSGLIHHFRHIEKRNFEDVSEKEMLSFLKNSAAQNRSDVGNILQTWQNHVPADQLAIQSFERVAEDPKGLIKDTYAYLGVDDSYLPPESLYKKKINAYTRTEFEMPESVREILLETGRTVAEQLEKTHPEITKNWKGF